MQQTEGHRLHQPVRSLEQVEQTLQFQATILANVQESVIVTDLQGKIIYWNEGAQRIFGYSASEMLGKTPALLYPHVEETNLQTDLQQVLAGTDYLGEWEGRRKNGSVVWVDIRTTLLKGYHEHLDAPTQAAFLDKALANELTFLLDTIMEAMQLTNEMKPAKPEELVVAHIVREVVDQFASQQEEHALQLDISEQVTARADKHYLRQILRKRKPSRFVFSVIERHLRLKRKLMLGIKQHAEQEADP